MKQTANAAQAWLAQMESHIEAKRRERAHLTPAERIELGRKAALELYGPHRGPDSSWSTSQTQKSA